MEKEKPNRQKPSSNLSRQDFIRIGGTAFLASAGTLAAKKAISSTEIISPVEPSDSNESIIKTTCDLCPSGCGLDVRVVDGKAVKVEGNPLHPINQGVCCLRAQTSIEMLYSPERIQKPRRQLGQKGSGDWEEISWEEAIGIVVEKLQNLRNANEPHNFALIHGDLRGQMRGMVSQFMKSFGSPNLISRASLGEQAIRQTMFLSQGINGLPVYDLNNTNYVITFGGNLLESSRNVIYALGAVAFMRRGRPQRGKLVSVHPRLSLTGMKADEWIPIRPGTYGALALGMANVIINSKLYNEKFVDDFTFGFEDISDANGTHHQGFKNFVLEHYNLEKVSKITGVPSEVIARLAGEFATNQPAVAILPTEIGELASGNALYTGLAIYALNALVGSIDVKGGILVQRFPEMTPWPEIDFDQQARTGLTQPRVDEAGDFRYPLAISAIQNLPVNLLSEKPYPIKALFLLNANPVHDMPADFAKALLKVPFVVSFASVLDESAAHADLILPASTFLEIWGDDYLEGTGFAGVSLRQPVVNPVHNTRNPGDVILEISKKLGGPVSNALPYPDYKTMVSNRQEKLALDPKIYLSNGGWSEMVYFNAEPGSPAWADIVGRDRLNAPKDGRFDFFSRELFALLSTPGDKDCLPHFGLPKQFAENNLLSKEYPLFLVSQQLITQSQNWQGIIPTLQESLGLQNHMKWESWIEINPRTAEELGIHNGDKVRVESPFGKVSVTARLYEGLWPNAVYLPPGLGHRTLVSWGKGSPKNWEVGVNPNLLAAFSSEPLSGQAIFSPTRIRIIKE